MLPSIVMRVKALQPRTELHDEEESSKSSLHCLRKREAEARRRLYMCAVYMLNASQLKLHSLLYKPRQENEVMIGKL